MKKKIVIVTCAAVLTTGFQITPLCNSDNCRQIAKMPDELAQLPYYDQIDRSRPTYPASTFTGSADISDQY